MFLLNTAFVTHLEAILALTYLRDVINEDEVLLVHADFAHLALVDAFSALVKMVSQHFVEAV